MAGLIRPVRDWLAVCQSAVSNDQMQPQLSAFWCHDRWFLYKLRLNESSSYKKWRQAGKKKPSCIMAITAMLQIERICCYDSCLGCATRTAVNLFLIYKVCSHSIDCIQLGNGFPSSFSIVKSIGISCRVLKYLSVVDRSIGIHKSQVDSIISTFY